MGGQVVEELLVPLGAELSFEDLSKVGLHGLADRRGPSGDGVTDFLANVLDLNRDCHIATVACA